MSRGAVWGIAGSPFAEDLLRAFAALGLSTRLVAREEAWRAGADAPPPSFVLDIKFGDTLPQELRRRGVPYVGVSLDHWYLSPRSILAAPAQAGGDYVFTCDPDQVHPFRHLGFRHVEFLPFGVDVESFRPLEIPPEDLPRVGADVCFAGTPLLANPFDGYHALQRDLARRRDAASGLEADACQRMLNLLDEAVRLQAADLFRYRIPELMRELEWKHKVTFLADGWPPEKETWAIKIGVHIAMRQRVEAARRLARETGIAVWGPEGWKGLGLPGLDYRGNADRLTLLPRAINASKVVLNVSKPQFDTGVGPRILETLACGGFLLTNRVTAVTSLFVDGKDLVVYDSLDDLVEKARYYLAHEDERRAIAERGMRKVRAHHTWLHRARRIVEVLEEDGILKKSG